MMPTCPTSIGLDLVGLDLERRFASIFAMPMTVSYAASRTRGSTLPYARDDDGFVLREWPFTADARMAEESEVEFRLLSNFCTSAELWHIE